MVNTVRRWGAVFMVWGALLFIVLTLLVMIAFYGNPAALPKLQHLALYGGGVDLFLFAFGLIGLTLPI